MTSQIITKYSATKSLQQKIPVSSGQQKIKQQQLKSIVLKNQSSTEKGYYTYEDWKNLHSVLFTLTESHITSTVINCWRILKLINFGDDFVPTGLVYDTLMTLINVDETVEQTEYLLKTIFFKFIQFNGKYLAKQERQQLAFFKIIRLIVQGYRKIITDNLDTQNNNQQPSLNRNQQLYRLHNVFTYKKNLQKLKKIQTQFKSCTFQPKINQRSAEIGESRYRRSAKKIETDPEDKQQNFGAIDESVQFENQRQLYQFKANPVPQYPEHNAQGVSEHLQRMQRSREIRRINSLQQSSRKQVSGVEEFRLQQRAEQRKQQRLVDCRILFLIKVEVGKRVYRVKVRENMGVAETVEAIQKMVGFKNNEVEDVVKGYFLNWEKRQQNKNIRSKEETYSQSMFE